MSWDHKLFHRHLKTRRFGREIVHFAELDSTNRWLLQNQGQFATTGGVVVADHQTAGRGRQDRAWFDVLGKSLLFSVLLKHSSADPNVLLLGFIPALALGELLREKFADQHHVELKWPNDVLLNGKKISGVLGQTGVGGTTWPIVLGMGVNVAGKREEFPPELQQGAGSITTETGTSFAREVVLADLLNRMEPMHDDILEGETDSLRERWLALGPALGTRLTRRETNAVISGNFAGLGNRGQLLLRRDHGAIEEFVSGDIVY